MENKPSQRHERFGQTFLQIGTNDLAKRGLSPLTVGSAIEPEDFVRLLRDEYGVRLFVGQTIRRHLAGNLMPMSDCLPSILRLCWSHFPLLFIGHIGVQFWRASSSYLSYDGVHLNREAVMQCLNRLTT